MDAIKINSNKIDKIKYDCFAWNEAHNCCNALSEVLCQTRACPFYKTTAQNEQDKQKHYQRPEPKRVFLCEQPVVRLEDGKHYASAKEAAEQLGGRSQYIVDACNRKCDSSLGYHWRWL